MPAVGLAPGTLTVDPDALPSKVSVTGYGPDHLEEHLNAKLSVIAEVRKRSTVTWVHIEGLGNATTLREMASAFGLHPLTMEDIVHVRQRPKVEDYPNYQFIVLRRVSTVPPQSVSTSQASLVVGDSFVLTFEEQAEPAFSPVRERLRKGNPALRTSGSGYLAYSLIDALIDTYFPMLEALGERTESLQEEALLSPTSQTAGNINQLRRDLLDIRRAIWPLRDEMSKLLRAPRFVAGEGQAYLRDVLDHSLVLIDLLESLREISGSLMDLYLSSMSNRMNEVMKWLTIVSTIFIPLTFIAGIYGMNFSPDSSPYNMPELTAYWGYPAALMSMLVTGGLTTYFIWRKGWFRPMVELPLEATSSPPAPTSAAAP